MELECGARSFLYFRNFFLIFETVRNCVENRKTNLFFFSSLMLSSSQQKNLTVFALGSFTLGAVSAYLAQRVLCSAVTSDETKKSDDSDPVRDALIRKTKKLDPTEFRMPAEWEKHKGCWMGFPERGDNWSQNALPAQKNFCTVAEAIAKFEDVTVCASAASWKIARDLLPVHIRVVEMSQDDSWFRDQAPIFVVHKITGRLAAVCWDFNAWGRVCYDSWEQDKLISKKIADLERVPRMFPKMILEGGSIHVDGEGTLMTTAECLLEPNVVNHTKRNPDMSKKDIEARLSKYLSISNFISLPKGVHGDEDTNGHVDNMACFLGSGVVALHWTDDKEDPQYERSKSALNVLQNETDAKGRKIRVVKLYKPRNLLRRKEECPIAADGTAERTEGESMPGSYVNFYMCRGRKGERGVVLPQFGDVERDMLAVKTMQDAFKDMKLDVEIVPVMSRSILCGGGNIHCITQQQPLEHWQANSPPATS